MANRSERTQIDADWVMDRHSLKRWREEHPEFNEAVKGRDIARSDFSDTVKRGRHCTF